jgi:hypothetical protein
MNNELEKQLTEIAKKLDQLIEMVGPTEDPETNDNGNDEEETETTTVTTTTKKRGKYINWTEPMKAALMQAYRNQGKEGAVKFAKLKHLPIPASIAQLNLMLRKEEEKKELQELTSEKL